MWRVCGLAGMVGAPSIMPLGMIPWAVICWIFLSVPVCTTCFAPLLRDKSCFWLSFLSLHSHSSQVLKCCPHAPSNIQLHSTAPLPDRQMLRLQVSHWKPWLGSKCSWCSGSQRPWPCFMVRLLAGGPRLWDYTVHCPLSACTLLWLQDPSLTQPLPGEWLSLLPQGMVFLLSSAYYSHSHLIIQPEWTTLKKFVLRLLQN